MTMATNSPTVATAMMPSIIKMILTWPFRLATSNAKWWKSFSINLSSLALIVSFFAKVSLPNYFTVIGVSTKLSVMTRDLTVLLSTKSARLIPSPSPNSEVLSIVMDPALT